MLKTTLFFTYRNRSVLQMETHPIPDNLREEIVALLKNRPEGLSPYDLTRRFTFRFLGPKIGRVPVGMKNDFLTLVRAMEAVRFGALRNLMNHKSFDFLETCVIRRQVKENHVK